MSTTGKNSILVAIFVIITVVAVLGALGFYHFEKPGNDALTLWDSFWWAMVTVTTIGYGDIYPKTVGGRLVALFLMFAGIGTLGVFTAAIAAYFIRGDVWQRFRLNWFKGHVVICGLGDKGLLLVKAFRAGGRDVVVIEQNEAGESAGTARDLGAVVLYADAREIESLRLARLEQARHLIVVCGDDGVNAEIAARARELSSRRERGPQDTLVCSAHIVNPELWYLLREWEMAQSGPFRLQFFNVVDGAARALLDVHPPFEWPTSQTPCLLIVGDGRLAQSVLVGAARAWREVAMEAAHATPENATTDNSAPALPKLHVSLIGRDTHRIRDILHMRHPELEKVCEVTALEIGADEPEFHQATFLFDDKGFCQVTRIYVCLPDDAAGLSAALSLHGRTRHARVPIIVAMTQESGLSALLESVRDTQPRFQTLHAVGLMERACQPDLVLGGIPEILARALHDKYIEDQEAAGATPQSNPLLVPWDKLPEDARESNRAQAMHIGEKLQTIGCDIVPLSDWDAHTFAFTPGETESMAQMEHERWIAERMAQGWSYGPRDPAKKTNPNLVRWDQLEENTREFNRSVVREIPVSLARAGFQVYRMRAVTPEQ